MTEWASPASGFMVRPGRGCRGWTWRVGVAAAVLASVALDPAAWAHTPTEPPTTQPATQPEASRNFLGVLTASAPPSLRQQLGLPSGVGLLVHHVLPGSPAERAGLRRHDVMHRLADQLLTHPAQLRVLLQLVERGEAVPIRVIRAGQSRTVRVVPDQRPADVYPPHTAPVVPPTPEAALAPEAKRHALQLVQQLRQALTNRWATDPQADAATAHRLEQTASDLLARLRDTLASAAVTGSGPELRPRLTSRYTDAEHRLVLKQTDDGKELEIHNREGERLYRGPLPPPQRWDRFGPELRHKLETLVRLQAQQVPPTAASNR